jgi:hypothetical protein
VTVDVAELEAPVEASEEVRRVLRRRGS